MARKKRFAPNDNNLAIAYYCFSSHSQNDASIDQQRDLAHEWADAHGFTIVQEYEDAAISGTTDARPGFQQMLSEVAKIRPHTLIMWKTDRLGRDKYVLAMAKKENPRRGMRDSPARREYPDGGTRRRPHRGIDGGHGGVLQPPAVAEHPARHGLQRAARLVQRPQAVRL